jgi:hypothetical protein
MRQGQGRLKVMAMAKELLTRAPMPDRKEFKGNMASGANLEQK